MIEQIKAESADIADDDDGIIHTEYATPFAFQLKTVTMRTLRSFWRQADYGFT